MIDNSPAPARFRIVSFLKSLAFGMPCLFLTGCIVPYPHLVDRSPAVSGRIIDSTTHQPIARVKIRALSEKFTTGPDGKPGYLYRPSSPSTRSGADGSFKLRETHNMGWYIVFGPCGGGPSDGVGKICSGFLVSKDGYQPVMFFPGMSGLKDPSADLRAIPLTPGHASVVTEYRPASWRKSAPLRSIPVPPSVAVVPAGNVSYYSQY